MPGAGKTWWAGVAGSRLSVGVADTDTLIAEEEGMAIPVIFDKHGETYFRKRERERLQRIAAMPGNIICSTGGGMGADLENLQVMRASGKIVYLYASLDTLWKHIQNDPGKRPLLNNSGEGKEALAALYAKRKIFYEAADFTFDVETQTTEELIEIIRSCIKQP
ncbi:MAG: hypothetical protein EOP49_21870 [Sphingobacteriales bacterium]|nr:MAG: hypothetical protein EOP49_21870 [Sphingobacteriales bacterium]